MSLPPLPKFISMVSKLILEEIQNPVMSNREKSTNSGFTCLLISLFTRRIITFCNFDSIARYPT